MFVVTAPTGQIGSRLVCHLLDHAADVRVIVRDPDRLDPRVRDAVEITTGSHGDPAVLEQALQGADALFWLTPPDPGAASVHDAYVGFTEPAAKVLQGSDDLRVVGISALGRGTGLEHDAGYVTGSLAMDDLLASTGVAYRALALPSFFENVARQAALIAQQGIFTSPIRGSVAMPHVAIDDIAGAAAELLVDESWDGTGTRPVLGHEDLSFDDMAATMTEVLGRPVAFRQVDPDAFLGRMTGVGMSEAMARGMLDMALAKDAGLDLGVERTPELTTPTSFREWTERVLEPLVTPSTGHGPSRGTR